MIIVVTSIHFEVIYMAIPKEILAIERPKNTVVKETRKPGVYSVVKRTSKRVPGKKNLRPVEIGVIGKIADGRYIPNPEKPVYETDFKIYGTVSLCNKVGRDIYDDLLKFYTLDDARKLFCIAVLRAIEPDITNEEIAAEYETTFLSELFPKVALSPNTISDFLEKIGKGLCTINEFMNDRIAGYSGHPTVIDGMLKCNTSTTNIFSEYSRKGRIKGTEDVSLLYAYDLTIREPVACSAFPGNMLDYTALRSFTEEHPIENGFLMMDKGFDDKISKEKISELNTHYIIPIKNSSKIIQKHSLDKNYTNSFKYNGDTIRCKKVLGDNGKFYYAYKSSEMKANQDKGYVARALDKGTFDEEKYEKKESRFGLIVFEANVDLELKVVYHAYHDRWEIETLFNNYKNIVGRQEVNVQGNYRLFATEFINFLSSIISLRIKHLIEKKKLNEKYTQHQVLRLLSKCAKRRSTKNSDKWVDCARLKYIGDLCEILGV